MLPKRPPDPPWAWILTVGTWRRSARSRCGRFFILHLVAFQRGRGSRHVKTNGIWQEQIEDVSQWYQWYQWYLQRALRFSWKSWNAWKRLAKQRCCIAVWDLTRCRQEPPPQPFQLLSNCLDAEVGDVTQLRARQKLKRCRHSMKSMKIHKMSQGKTLVLSITFQLFSTAPITNAPATGGSAWRATLAFAAASVAILSMDAGGAKIIRNLCFCATSWSQTCDFKIEPKTQACEARSEPLLLGASRE